MKQLGYYRYIFFICIVSVFFIMESYSISYELINSQNWVTVTNQDNIYPEPNWTTYSVRMDNVARLRILENGTFHFAWKTPRLDSDDRLYFKHSHIQNILSNTMEWNTTDDYNVNENEEVSWYLINNISEIWIALPPDDDEIITINLPPSIPQIEDAPTEGNIGEIYNFSINSNDPEGGRIIYAFDWGDGRTTRSDLTPSGDSVILNHSWSNAGIYNITIIAEDENGSRSSPSRITVRISSVYTPEPSNNPPSEPRILSACSEGYNESVYDFSVTSDDADQDKIKYYICWGDEKTSQSDLTQSGDPVILNHSWSNAGIYNIAITASDEHGENSSLCKMLIRISWLVKVPPNESLQNIFNNLSLFSNEPSTNITFQLEGTNYSGFEIVNNTRNINILPSSAICSIYSINNSVNCAIGLENSTNISIQKLSVSGETYGIILSNCSNCMIRGNIIEYKNGRGIHVVLGNDNSIENNDINRSEFLNSNSTLFGISIEDSSNDRIICNNITGSFDINDALYYIKNSTISKFTVVPNDDCLLLIYNNSGEKNCIASCASAGEINKRLNDTQNDITCDIPFISNYGELMCN